MKPPSNLAPAFAAIAKTLFGLAGMSFLFGGGLIHAVTKMDRFTAELVGIAIFGTALILGLLANELADRLIDRNESPSSASPGSS
jgi:4-hydroxybenzoate polyprenyltransferase